MKVHLMRIDVNVCAWILMRIINTKDRKKEGEETMTHMQMVAFIIHPQIVCQSRNDLGRKIVPFIQILF